jgi:hypothetical protein
MKTKIQDRWLLYYCLSRMMGRTHDEAYHEAWGYLAKQLCKQRQLMDGMWEVINA